MSNYKTIRQTAAMGILPEYRLRLMVAAGECPGFKCGNRFLINIDLLSAKLEALSLESAQQKQEAEQ